MAPPHSTATVAAGPVTPTTKWVHLPVPAPVQEISTAGADPWALTRASLHVFGFAPVQAIVHGPLPGHSTAALCPAPWCDDELTSSDSEAALAASKSSDMHTYWPFLHRTLHVEPGAQRYFMFLHASLLSHVNTHVGAVHS